MRLLIVAALLVLASCATNSAVPALENRLSSWAGSSVHELAKELGEPTTVTENSWEWQFTGPGMQASTSAFSIARHSSAKIGGSATGDASSPGIEGKSWTRSIDSSIPRKECRYIANIDGETIVEVQALVVSGRCSFGEIPLHDSVSSGP